MNATLDYVTRKITDYFTRIRTPSRALLGGGIALILYDGLAAGFPALNLLWTSQGQSVEISVSDAPSEYISLVRIAVGLLCIAVGGIWSFRDQRREEARNARSTMIAIESRGLRDEQGRSLSDAVSTESRCRVDEVLVDLRRFNREGRVHDPEGAVHEIMQIRGDLRRRRAQKDRDDIALAYGGLTPVPFTFLLGVLLDDERPITTWDWDRTQNCWRKVEDTDDGRRFTLQWQPPQGAPSEVVVAISASYPILDENLQRKFPGVPIMRLDLEGRGQDSHWSEVKQAALATQFLDALKELEGLGVKTAHLVIAAPNSLVFRLGTRYDGRNVPGTIVYQFERDAAPPYPWGVAMPGLGGVVPHVVRADNVAAS